MTFFLWLWNFLSPFVIILGFFGWGFVEEWMLFLCLISAVLGFFVGLIGWNKMIPPRWFWVKDRVNLLNNRIGTAFKYAFQFSFLPMAIVFLVNAF